MKNYDSEQSRSPAGQPLPYGRGSLALHAFAAATVVATFVLIIVGGIVTTRGAGLAVPDWPLSYGQLMPERWYAMANIAAEHGHRMIAAVVGIMMLALAIHTQCVEPRRWVRVLAWLALAAVVSQALLGGATVLILGQIRPFIRVCHAALAQTFFMLIITLAVVTSRWWRESNRSDDGLRPSAMRRVAVMTTVVLFGQLMLGAVMRHTESGLALTEFPASYAGGLLPPTDADGLARLNEDRDFDYYFEPVSMMQVWVNFAHRAGAVVVIAAVAAMAVFVFRFHADEPRFVSPAVLLVGLLVVQVGLGVATVMSLENVWVTTLHVGTGVFMFAQSFNLTLRAFRLAQPSRRARALPAVELGVAAS